MINKKGIMNSITIFIIVFLILLFLEIKYSNYKHTQEAKTCQKEFHYYKYIPCGFLCGVDKERVDFDRDYDIKIFECKNW